MEHTFKQRLLHVKGKHHVRVSEVMKKLKTLNTHIVYIMWQAYIFLLITITLSSLSFQIQVLLEFFWSTGMHFIFYMTHDITFKI